MPDGVIYVTDAVYSREPMEVTEADWWRTMLPRVGYACRQPIESNNGGRGIRPRGAGCWRRGVRVGVVPPVRLTRRPASSRTQRRWFIRVRFPCDWALRWPELYAHLTTYRWKFRANRWHDAADVVTGLVEREIAGRDTRIKSVKFM